MPSVIHDDEKSALPSPETGQLRGRAVALLKQADREAEQFRRKIAALLIQIEALNEAEESRHARECLISRLREANKNLVIATFGAQEMQANAESINLRQEEFLSMLAHELRNPLAPISLATEMLGNLTAAHPKLPGLHGIINRQVNHLTHLVDDLVDASRISNGKITLKSRILPLSEIIESAVETGRPFIDKRRQKLSIDLPEEPIAIDGDLVRLAQVFSNLLINAAKFTPEEGRISVSARKAGGSVEVSVKDDGMGIAPDMQPFIFDLFTQGPCSLDRSQGGLGIGLSLVRTLVEMHGGNARVQSGGAGMGSEFTIVLPVSNEPLPRDSGPIEKVKPALLHPRRVLIIEDNADINDTLNNLLTQEGHIATSAFNGMSGVALAKKNAYDIIVCDIGLSGLDGYEVIKELRRHGLNPVPCFIAMTGYHQQESRTRGMEAGFDHYLVKPVAVQLLMNIISLKGLH